MGFDGAHGQVQLFGDLGIGLAQHHQAQHLGLTIGELVGITEKRHLFVHMAFQIVALGFHRGLFHAD